MFWVNHKFGNLTIKKGMTTRTGPTTQTGRRSGRVRQPGRTFQTVGSVRVVRLVRIVWPIRVIGLVCVVETVRVVGPVWIVGLDGLEGPVQFVGLVRLVGPVQVVESDLSWSSSPSGSSYPFDNSTREYRMWGWVRRISNFTYFEGIWIFTNLANWNPSKKCLHLKCFLIFVSKQSISLQKNLNSSKKK